MRLQRGFAWVMGAMLALSGLWACDDDATGPNGTEGDADLQFVFSGDRSGSYSTEGLPEIGSSNLPEASPWAIAHPDSLGGVVILGYQAGSDGKGDLFILQLHPLQAGTWPGCGNPAADHCHGRLIVGVSPEDPSSPDAWFEITEGSVVLTRAEDGEVVGTFDAVFETQDGSESFAVTDGSIQVPLSSDSIIGLGMACLVQNLQNGTSGPC